MNQRRRRRTVLEVCLKATIGFGVFATIAFAGANPPIAESDLLLLFQGWSDLRPQLNPPLFHVLIFCFDNWWFTVELHDLSDPPDGIPDGIQAGGGHLVNPHPQETRPPGLLSELIGDVFPPDEGIQFPYIAAPVFVNHPGPEAHKDKLEVRVDKVFVGGIETTRVSVQISHQDSEGQYPPPMSGPLGQRDNCPPNTLCDDCNKNGIHDAEDIALGTSQDCDQNGIPDECEPDCDRNEIADSCEAISTGACNSPSMGCIEISQCQCQRTGIGTYQGDGTACPATPSVPTIGLPGLVAMIGTLGCMIVLIFRQKFGPFMNAG